MRHEKTLDTLVEAYKTAYNETGASTMLTRAIRQVISTHYGHPGLQKLVQFNLEQQSAPAEVQQSTEPIQKGTKRPSIHSKVNLNTVPTLEAEEPAQRQMTSPAQVEETQPAPAPAKKKSAVERAAAEVEREFTADLHTTTPGDQNAELVDFEQMEKDLKTAMLPYITQNYSKAQLVAFCVVKEIELAQDPQELSARQLAKVIKERLK